MSLLQNGIDSIALGIEDLNSTDQRRLVSCARNIFAGILLLFKHKLAELSPSGSQEVLIKQRVLPALDSSGQLLWRGQGRKTVDVPQIRERFESLGVSLDWKRVENINDYRNDIEHYYSTLSHSAVRTLIADSFVVIRDFVRNHLCRDPLDLLGHDTWATLTQVADVYDREKKLCETHMEPFDWKYASLEAALRDHHCSNCGSGLIDVAGDQPDRDKAEFRCLSCGRSWDFESMAELALGEYFARDNYEAVRHGGEPATVDCPFCGKETYVLDEDCCILCEESAERECQLCGETIAPYELCEDGYCSHCAHVLSKDE